MYKLTDEHQHRLFKKGVREKYNRRPREKDEARAWKNRNRLKNPTPRTNHASNPSEGGVPVRMRGGGNVGCLRALEGESVGAFQRKNEGGGGLLERGNEQKKKKKH